MRFPHCCQAECHVTVDPLTRFCHGDLDSCGTLSWMRLVSCTVDDGLCPYSWYRRRETLTEPGVVKTSVLCQPQPFIHLPTKCHSVDTDDLSWEFHWSWRPHQNVLGSQWKMGHNGSLHATWEAIIGGVVPVHVHATPLHDVRTLFLETESCRPFINNNCCARADGRYYLLTTTWSERIASSRVRINRWAHQNCIVQQWRRPPSCIQYPE